MTSSPSEAAPVPPYRVCDDGVIVRLGEHSLKLEVCAPHVVRVAGAADEAFFARASLAVLPRSGPRGAWQVEPRAGGVAIRTAELEARVDFTAGVVSFFDHGGQLLLAEAAGGRTFTPAEEPGERGLQVRQQWVPPADDEALFGLGQHQFGLMNIKGRDLDLWQRNTVIAVPMLVSSCGYGILWDQNARTRFGDLRPLELLRAELTATFFADGTFTRAVATRQDEQIDLAAGPGIATTNHRVHPALPETGEASVRWEGTITSEVTGLHTLQPFYNAGLKVWLDDVLIVDHWRQGWLYWYDQVQVRLEAGRRHRLRIDWVIDQGDPTLRFFWKTPTTERMTALWSGVADGIDYYFIHGPALDRVIAGYRLLTGAAPMMPVWAFGLWQSRERYRTAQESLDVLARYRALGVPIDNIVQDWLFWRLPEWGSHEFDAERFPDPDGWIRAIHEQHHARLMISVWAKYHTGTANFEAMRSRGFLYQPNLDDGEKDWLGFAHTFYDAFNPAARDLYWEQMERALFRRGVDAWWMDATEPEMRHAPMYETIRDSIKTTALGPAARVMLAYPLVHNEGVYTHQRAAAPDQRVFILTRSGFSGMQRCAAACWSGDITSTWTALQKQIPAGLSLGLSGIPYWTTDSGGFSVPPRWCGRDEQGSTPNAAIMAPAAAAEWAELNVRWLQYATFCPLMRIHGQFPFREMWEFGGEDSAAFKVMAECDRLRYRLLPYIYAVAGAITHEGGTLMRALVLDFPRDATAREVGDQFMFGPALLVSPVTVHRARSRRVYLPATAGGWYDFWTGGRINGGQGIEADAPFERIPIHVRAGAIVPFGPPLQYTTEKPADPITLLVYAGADGAFTLYEDDGLSYGYERGAAARVALTWKDAARTLTIGARTGEFPGMLRERTFKAVVIGGAGSSAAKVERVVRYDGAEVQLRM